MDEMPYFCSEIKRQQYNFSDKNLFENKDLARSVLRGLVCCGLHITVLEMLVCFSAILNIYLFM